MRRILSLFISIILLISTAISVSATSQDDFVLYKENILEDGITYTDEITIYSYGRATQKKAELKRTFTRDNTTIAVIAYEAVFQYDGSTVSVLSKTITQTDTYNNWNFKQSSFTSSGGTVTLTGSLKKLLVLNVPVNLTLTCDKNGNIS